ncbi:MAG: disulfide bond formation protein B [Alphaproteobacteria bacterium]|nr:disulfide bond formation protein B [Alphaproteobacteria bacterium]
MPLARPRLAALLLALASAGALGFALVSQYAFGLPPCVLCLYQRVPYLAALVLGLAAFAWAPGRPYLLALAGLALLGNTGIALFHVGVEQHWWQGLSGCSGAAGATSFEEMRRLIQQAPIVRCDEVAWSFLGLSMAGWNVPATLVLGSFAGFAAWRSWPR